MTNGNFKDRRREAAPHRCHELYALGGSASSMHVLIMAAQEVLFAVAKSRGVALHVDMEDYIRPEGLAEYRRLKNRAYNFFKHADRDASDVYEKSEEELDQLNEVLLVMTLANAKRIGIEDATFMAFTSGLGLINPSMVDWDGLLAERPDLRDAASEFIGNLSREMLRTALLGQLILSGHCSEAEIRQAPATAASIGRAMASSRNSGRAK